MIFCGLACICQTTKFFAKRVEIEEKIWGGESKIVM